MESRKDSIPKNRVYFTELYSMPVTWIRVTTHGLHPHISFISFSWNSFSKQREEHCSVEGFILIGSYCYSVHVQNSKSISWTEAKMECEKMNSTLLTLPTKADVDAFRSIGQSAEWTSLYPSSGIPVVIFLGLINHFGTGVSILMI